MMAWCKLACQATQKKRKCHRKTPDIFRVWLQRLTRYPIAYALNLCTTYVMQISRREREREKEKIEASTHPCGLLVCAAPWWSLSCTNSQSIKLFKNKKTGMRLKAIAGVFQSLSTSANSSSAWEYFGDRISGSWAVFLVDVVNQTCLPPFACHCQACSVSWLNEE